MDDFSSGSATNHSVINNAGIHAQKGKDDSISSLIFRVLKFCAQFVHYSVVHHYIGETACRFGISSHIHNANAVIPMP
jgi:hypothetical protein